MRETGNSNDLSGYRGLLNFPSWSVLVTWTSWLLHTGTLSLQSVTCSIVCSRSRFPCSSRLLLLPLQPFDLAVQLSLSSASPLPHFLHLPHLLYLPLLHWPARSASPSSSPPPPPAAAGGPSRPGASSRPPLASCAPPPTSAAEPAPPSPGSVRRGDRGTDGGGEGVCVCVGWEGNRGEKGRRGQYVNFRQILQYKESQSQRRHMRAASPNAGFCQIDPSSLHTEQRALLM